MSAMSLIWISYVLIPIFVVAFVIRTIRLAKLPVHLRWELAPVPHEKGKAHYGGSYFEEFEWWTKPRERSHINELIYMVKEIVFLKSVFENNRRLWWFSFPFHFGMYLLLGAFPLVVIEVIAMSLAASGSAWSAFGSVVSVIIGVGFALGIVGALGLVAMRMTDRAMKATGTPTSIFNLALLLAVFVSGGYALLTSHGFAVDMWRLFKALFTASAPSAVPPALTVHLLVTLVFLAYLPFTPMMHFVAKYFTYHQVRWDDRPMKPGDDIERQVKTLLGQAVTWSGPHLNADGTKNWADIAKEDPSP